MTCVKGLAGIWHAKNAVDRIQLLVSLSNSEATEIQNIFSNLFFVLPGLDMKMTDSRDSSMNFQYPHTITSHRIVLSNRGRGKTFGGDSSTHGWAWKGRRVKGKGSSREC